MPNINIDFSISVLFIILLVVAACAVATYYYRTTLPPIPRWKRFLLTALRAAALSLVLILIFEPLLSLVRSFMRPPGVAVLIDDSRSMQIQDKDGDRGQILSSVVHHSSMNRLAGNTELHWHTFGARLTEHDGLDSLALSEEATDISSALKQLGEQKERNNIRAAVLVTDGAFNLGQNPLYEAEKLGIPIYTVGIGDSSEQRDVLITKVVTNSLVYSDVETPVDVTIKSSGFGGKNVDVVLMEGNKELKRATLALQDGTREYPVSLPYTPEGEGMKKFTLRVSGIEGELTTDNNRKSFFARILKSKLRVVLLGLPGPDFSILEQTLAEEKNIAVRSFAQRPLGGWYGETPNRAALDSADCLMLIGLPTTTTDMQTLELVRVAALDAGKPLFFIDGKGVDDGRLRTLGPSLPFIPSPSSAIEQLIFLQPSGTQKNHPILNGGIEGAWDRLPPIFSKQSRYKARPEAVVLGNIRIMNVATPDPLMIIRNVNRQKSMAILGYGVWRWRLMAQGTPDTEKLLSALLANSIRWLTTREDNKPVKVAPSKDIYTHGEPVEFLGQVYDASGRPVESAQLRVTAIQDNREFETLLRPIGNGRYEGTIDGLAVGDYSYRAVAALDGQPLGEDRGRFSVGELNLEFLDTKMNISLLRLLASRTGGKYYSPDDIGGLPSDLATQPTFKPEEVLDTTRLELWNWQYMLALIVTLFAVEWFIRKRSGML
ncbi:MAG: hypothetical protein ACKVRP_04895 [Bacteroidota bacterium]